MTVKFKERKTPSTVEGLIDYFTVQGIQCKKLGENKLVIEFEGKNMPLIRIMLLFAQERLHLFYWYTELPDFPLQKKLLLANLFNNQFTTGRFYVDEQKDITADLVLPYRPLPGWEVYFIGQLRRLAEVVDETYPEIYKVLNE